MAQEGACLFSKRLEKGRFVWPSAKDGKIALTPAQLAMLLEGEADQQSGTCPMTHPPTSRSASQFRITSRASRSN